MTAKASGTLNSDIDKIDELTIQKPQRAWRDNVKTFMGDLVDTYYHKAIGRASLASNADETGINNVDEYMRISGTYDVGTLSFMKNGTDGQLTYTGNIRKDFFIASSIFLKPASGGPLAAQRLYINDSPISASKLAHPLSSATGNNSTLTWVESLNVNDTIHIEIANLEDTTNLTAETHHLIVHSIN